MPERLLGFLKQVGPIKSYETVNIAKTVQTFFTNF